MSTSTLPKPTLDRFQVAVAAGANRASITVAAKDKVTAAAAAAAEFRARNALPTSTTVLTAGIVKLAQAVAPRPMTSQDRAMQARLRRPRPQS